MVHTLAPGSPTCSSWCTLSTGAIVANINGYAGLEILHCMDNFHLARPGHYLVHFKKSSFDRTFPSQAKEARQPVCAAPLRLQDPPPGLPDPAAGRGQLQGELSVGLKFKSDS